MATVLNNAPRGPFGGPAGGIQQAMSGVLKYIMQKKEAEKRNKNQQIINDILANQGQPAQMDYMGAESGGAGASIPSQPYDYNQAAAQIMQAKVPAASKAKALSLLGAQKQISTPPPSQKVDYAVIDFWDRNGAKRSIRVPEQSYNNAVEKIVASGGTLDSPAKVDFSKVDFWDRNGKKRSVRVSEKNYNKTVEKIVASGGTLENPAKGKGDGDLSPSQQINQRKLQAWDSYMKGEASPEQQKMIGVDDDPYLARAAQMVVQDMNNFGKSSEDLAKMSIKLANVLRRARQQNPSPGPGGGESEQIKKLNQQFPGYVPDWKK